MVSDPDYAVIGLFQQSMQPRLLFALMLIVVNAGVENLFCLINNYKAARMFCGYVHAGSYSCGSAGVHIIVEGVCCPCDESECTRYASGKSGFAGSWRAVNHDVNG